MVSRARRAAWVARLATVAVIALVAPSACTAGGSSAAPNVAPSPVGSASSVAPSLPPPSAAALAGGACLLLNYATVRKELGTDFSVAAAADSSGSYSCVLQEPSAKLPSLTLSITATDLSTADFKAHAIPSGSSSVSKLGKIAYQKVTSATKSAGPMVEVGWLSGNNRLITFQYACPTGTSSATAKALATKMVSLAKIVDQTTV